VTENTNPVRAASKNADWLQRFLSCCAKQKENFEASNQKRRRKQQSVARTPNASTFSIRRIKRGLLSDPVCAATLRIPKPRFQIRENV
jgi:hypothetical protein